jgi:hypothetical protein
MDKSFQQLPETTVGKLAVATLVADILTGCHKAFFWLLSASEKFRAALTAA